MALNTSKCNHLTPLPFKGLIHKKKRQAVFLYTFFAHACPEALAKAAVSALVALVLVDDTASLKAARVDVTLAYRSTEESLTAVTRRRAVVLTGSAVVADSAGGTLARTGRRDRELSIGRQ